MQVPPSTHSRWIDLLTGKVARPPSFIAARMLIVQCRIGLAKTDHRPDELQRYAARLHELYVKNADSPAARQDLAAIFG